MSLTLIQIRYIVLSSLGSVYLGKDIRTGAEIAVKIGCADHSSSRLCHEYKVYTELAGSAGISSVRWYGKEGPYEVIVMNHLGTSLGDLTIRGQVDVFQYASQMVCSSQGSSCKYKYLTEHSHTHSSRQLNRYTLGTTSIMTSSQQTSWFEPITFTLLFSSLTSAWHNYTTIPQHIYTTQTLKITSSSVLFHSRLSPANEDLLNRVATTWSLLSILLFIQHVVPCLGPFPPTVPTVITGQSSRRRY